MPCCPLMFKEQIEMKYIKYYQRLTGRFVLILLLLFQSFGSKYLAEDKNNNVER